MNIIKVIGSPLYQWEVGRKIQIFPHGNLKVAHVHFSHIGDPEALVVMPKEEDGMIIADIPNILMQGGQNIVVYVVDVAENCVETLRDAVLAVRKRARPADYVYTESEVLNYAYLDNRLNQLEGDGLANAVADYLKENPVQAGATKEEAAQIQQNKTDIEQLAKEKLDKSGGTLTGNLNLSGSIVIPTNGSAGIRDNTDMPVMRYENVDGELCLRVGQTGARITMYSSERPKYNGKEIALKSEIPEGGTVTDEQIASAVEDYMAEHPVTGGTVATVEPAEDDIPKVFFGGALQQTKDEKVTTFRYISKTQDISGYAEIKAQGNSSMNYPKKNQTVKLYKDAECTEKLKVDFKGWGKQSKHVYKANWIDLTHARNVVSARLWADVVKSRSNYAELPELLRTSPNQGAVDGFPVKVYANGVYQGRYTLNIPKDAWMANMDDELDNHCILCSENYTSGCFRAAANINESDWTDEVHDTVPSSIKTRWNEVISFVMNSTDEEFKTGLSDYFCVDSLIDYDLFGLASCGLDAYGKNQIYMTYNGRKWIAHMYDMDSTWGLYWDGSKFVAADYGRNQYEDRVKSRPGNLLYIRLEKCFWAELQARWEELRSGALSIENIINRFERFMDIVPAELVKEDYASTTGGGGFTGIPSQTTNNIQQIRAFALARRAWTDEYVAGLTQDDGGDGTHTHSYTSKVTTAATCTTAGVKTFTCSCGHSYTESIPATGHNYVDGVCTVCGAADPGYTPEVTMTGISAVYSGGDVVEGTSLTDLTGIVVTATYSDGSTEEVTGYTLSGEIVEGENTITVSYDDMTTTFAVTGFAKVLTYTETTLRENYSPNGESWTDTTDIDFAAGDYVEAEIDLSTCTTNKENVFSLGSDISKFRIAGEARAHVYWCTDSTLEAYMFDGGSASVNSYMNKIEITDSKLVIRVDVNGMNINGNAVKMAATSIVKKMSEFTSVQIGSAEGNVRSRATYNYIKVYRVQ